MSEPEEVPSGTEVDSSRGRSILLTFAALAVVIAGLRAAADVLIPFAVAVFVAIICLPAILFLQGLHLTDTALEVLRRAKLPEKWVQVAANLRIGTVPAVGLVVLGLLIPFIGIGVLVGTSIGDFRGTIEGYRSGDLPLSDSARELSDWASRVPELFGPLVSEDAELLGSGAAEGTESASETPVDTEQGSPAAGGEADRSEETSSESGSEPGSSQPEQEASEKGTAKMSALDPNTVLNFALSVVSGAGTLLSNSFLVLMIAALLLLEAAGFPAKLREALGNPQHDLHDFTRIVVKIQRYLWIKTVVSLITGVTLGLMCWALDVRYAVLWGLLAFVLNFIPNIGSILAMVPPSLLAFAEHGTLLAAVVAAGYLLVNTVVGNYLEPLWMGRQLGLSTLVVFLSMLFWGWTWGAVGMFLSVPLSMSVKIFLENTKDLRWMAVLMASSRGDYDEAEKAAEPGVVSSLWMKLHEGAGARAVKDPEAAPVGELAQQLPKDPKVATEPESAAPAPKPDGAAPEPEASEPGGARGGLPARRKVRSGGRRWRRDSEGA